LLSNLINLKIRVPEKVSGKPFVMISAADKLIIAHHTPEDKRTSIFYGKLQKKLDKRFLL